MNKLLPLALLAACTIAGCRSNRAADAGVEPATRPTATDVDPVKATPEYWLDQPAVATATGDDFDRLFRAAERAARDRYFVIDQADRRAGLIVTAPSTSKQFFEVWRNDTGTARGTLDSSLATHRRTLRYEFTRNPDGTYTVTPKVLVERYSTQGRRVTVPAYAMAAFDPPAEESDPAYRHYPWDPTYWYAVGRDAALERKIVRSIETRLAK
jgi:hypothetical protein